jgi:hypothetical protein
VDYAELYKRMCGQGPESIKRINCYKNIQNISIPMAYAFALLYAFCRSLSKK